jgi:transposase
VGFIFRCNLDQQLPCSRPASRHNLSLRRGPTEPTIAEVTQAIEQEVEKCCGTALDDSSRVAALTALAFVLIIRRANRFQCGKQIASYLGLVPLDESSGER